MKQFKIGDRVKIKSTGKTGIISYRTLMEGFYSVELDAGGSVTGVRFESLIRLRKKKKESTANITTLWSIGSNHGTFITKEQLAKMWNAYIWGEPHVATSHASESKVFEKICKELGFE